MSSRLSPQGHRAATTSRTRTDRVRPRTCDRWPWCQSDHSAPLREVEVVFLFPGHREVELVFLFPVHFVLLDQMVHDVGQLLTWGIETHLQLSELQPFGVIEQVA